MPATPITVIVIGVSGVGKSLVAKALAEAIGVRMAEGDDFHSSANVAKMASGQPLDDEDRWPWLRSIAAWIGEQERAGRSRVVTCSALRRGYRDLLRDGHPSVAFCELFVNPATIRARLAHRSGHFMPAGLLDSQLATRQPLADDEPGIRVAAEDDLGDVVARVRIALDLRAEG